MNEQQQQYIEHEVQIRVLRETTESKFLSMQKNYDDKFDAFEKRTDFRFQAIDKELTRIDTKINWVLGIMVMGIFISIFLKVIGVF